ncbi:DEAD/DEAH box helicase family protein [uncultured Mailhella sp.]|uniref:DEAD/DEAH box helicase family protein n=1 Tax=uncultured Mailhella sp. TaxID=1981031 RepID=UPI0026115FEC|nr:DEAD/DEAH box helicase family protein [uncultured Mailhella sp.]
MAMKTKDWIKTSSKVEPKIYAYTTPGVAYHDGYIKIGYTEQDVKSRIDQQTRTAGIKYKLEWDGRAVYTDGSKEPFRDTDFHVYLRRVGVKQPQDEGNEDFPPADRNEWFHIGPDESKGHFIRFCSNHGVLRDDLHAISSYLLREEQEEAVLQTVQYYKTHEGGEFLWNAKPRFGKTLSVYDFILRTKAQRVLVVTNRPAIAHSWYSDYERFIGRKNRYFFVRPIFDVKREPLTISYEEYLSTEEDRAERFSNAQPMGLIEFVSLQDLKGALRFGGKYDKLQEIEDIDWDLLVIDEAHEGVDTEKTDFAFDRIHRSFTLHLSGTPFKALANATFPEDAIYNWTYADEQRKKAEWSGSGENPYAPLPKLNLFTYQMSQIIMDELKQGIEIEGNTEEYAFDLNEFFAVNNGRFIHDEAVDKFLDALTTQEKFPFSTPELRNELRHTFWLLNRVESARLLARKLEKHPVFSEYTIVLAAGDGRLDDADATKESYDRVVEAIAKSDKTITLSVGQLTTGVTIPEWTAVLMLSNVRSPALYMQAAFRAQNPCLFRTGDSWYRKENAYVFDFDPARTLVIFEQFANDLSRDTAAGRGDVDARKRHIRELLNFFPVVGEDDDGEMVELDAEKVLSIPRKIKSVEVVRSGFMCNFLFQNISGVFQAPQEVREIIDQFKPVSESFNRGSIDTSPMEDVPLDDNGDVVLSDEHVVGLTPDVFGEKIYREIEADVSETIQAVSVGIGEKRPSEIEAIKEKLRKNIVAPVVQKAKEHYGSDMRKSDERQLERVLKVDTDRAVNKVFGNYNIEHRTIELERERALRKAKEEGATPRQIERLNAAHDEKQKKARESLETELIDTMHGLVKSTTETAVKTMETNVKTRLKESIEDDIRDHLRGFSRTIPSFLMAYGTEKVTLANFDQLIPDKVFREVTGISLDQFRMLRDGGDYIDKETGETKHYYGHLFDETVFDDSVQEFLRKRAELADYFDESHTEDIFDYIPPQKTNQIFTPRRVVKKMVDALEQENPGCFDNPNHTFADLYMKSGLYITEIVKRLYNSQGLKAAFPDDRERILHILRKQVYGMAPTRIIYLIATNYILGFDEELKAETRNFVEADAAEAAKNGTLQDLVNRHFAG